MSYIEGKGGLKDIHCSVQNAALSDDLLIDEKYILLLLSKIGKIFVIGGSFKRYFKVDQN